MYSTGMRRMVLLSVIAAPFFMAACGRVQTKSIPPRTWLALGTVCTVNAFSDGSDRLYSEIFARLHEIDSRFSPGNPQSDISRINAAAGSAQVHVHAETGAVLLRALRYAELSSGEFDPSVGPLVGLWAINTDKAHVPSSAELDDARTLIDWRKVECTAEDGGARVRLLRRGMALDLGGIVKGYAADEIAALFKRRGVRRGIIDLGGNTYVYGAKADGAPWRIGIRNPVEPNGQTALALSVEGGTSVVTSGVYERFFVQDGTRYHHILSPRTGFPARTRILSVTVASGSSIEADALSTTLFLLGVDKAFSFLQDNAPDAGAVFITEDNKVIASESLRGRLSIMSGTFSDIEYR